MENKQIDRSLLEIIRELFHKILSLNKNNLYLKIHVILNIFGMIFLLLAFLNSISLIFTRDYAAFTSMTNIIKHIENAKWLSWISIIALALHVLKHHRSLNKKIMICSCLGNILVLIYVYFMTSTPLFTETSALSNTLKVMPLILLITYVIGLIVTYNKLFNKK